MKIGILGGTFNPVHTGHMLLGKCAKEQLNLPVLYYMPSQSPAYKNNSEILSFKDRFEMVKLAVSSELGGEENGYYVSDLESRREGNTYTCETLEMIKRSAPDDEIYFIIGADSLMNFHTWKNPEIVAGLCCLVVAGRTGYDRKCLEEAAEKVRNDYNGTVVFLDFCENTISSTLIRNDIKNGKLRSAPLPTSVKDYIYRNDLYELSRREITYTPEKIYEIIDRMKSSLDSYRFVHVLGVAYMAADVAAVYGIDQNKALVAGLLHDCAKNINKDELLPLCDKYGVVLSESERRLKHLIHAKLGAYIAKTEFKVEDSGILSAISFHTLGKPAMSRLEQIIFCVDFLEPQRDYFCEPDLFELRKLIFTDIDKTTLLIIENQLRFFKDMKKEAAPEIYDVYEYYNNLIESREN